MKTKATFYHAGCPVCIEAEHQLAEAIDPQRHELEIVHLGTQKDRLSAARAAGVKSVPALVMNNSVFHINFGASLDALG